MSARNNRDAYKTPTEAEIAKFRNDPQYIQWRDAAKMVWVLTGVTGFAKVTAKLDPKLIAKTEYWGWWRLTDNAYKEFSKTKLVSPI
jgi:hypothetical protein